MKILGIDPGQEHSGFVTCEKTHVPPYLEVFVSGEFPNMELLSRLRNTRLDIGTVFCETIEPMGLPVGHSTLDTMRWIGRFQEAWDSRWPDNKMTLVSRGDEKITLCGAATFMDPKTKRRRSVTDAHIRAALIDRFAATGGGKTPQIGTKGRPGPLYGVKGHAWSALAVVMTGMISKKNS